MPLFDALDFLCDEQPHPAALNMAIDEVLLKEISVPTLRVYRWLHPAASFGCFEKYSIVASAHPGRELVRRWTGGGVVLHGDDFTYSLIVPAAGIPSGIINPQKSYLDIHEALVRGMQAAGIAASLAGGTASKVSNACFENAVCHDVMLGDRKIAGAAQRRTRAGLLHQGSIQLAGLPEDFGETFAAILTTEVSRRVLPLGELPVALALAESKYASESWMRKF